MDAAGDPRAAGRAVRRADHRLPGRGAAALGGGRAGRDRRGRRLLQGRSRARLRQPHVPLRGRLPEGDAAADGGRLPPLSYTHRHPFVLKVHLPREDAARAHGRGRLGRRQLARARGLRPVRHRLRRATATCAASCCPTTGMGHPLRKDWVDPEFYNGMHVKPTAQMAERAMAGEKIGVGPFDVTPPNRHVRASDEHADLAATRRLRLARRGPRHRRDDPQHGPAAPVHPRRAAHRAAHRRRGRAGGAARTSATCTAASRSTRRTSTTRASSPTPTAWTTWPPWATRSATRWRSRS